MLPSSFGAPGWGSHLGVIIETTGLADPAPVAQTFFVDDDIEENYTLDGIITVVDAKHIIQHLQEEKPEGVVLSCIIYIYIVTYIYIYIVFWRWAPKIQTDFTSTENSLKIPVFF